MIEASGPATGPPGERGPGAPSTQSFQVRGGRRGPARSSTGPAAQPDRLLEIETIAPDEAPRGARDPRSGSCRPRGSGSGEVGTASGLARGHPRGRGGGDPRAQRPGGSPAGKPAGREVLGSGGREGLTTLKAGEQPGEVPGPAQAPARRCGDRDPSRQRVSKLRFALLLPEPSSPPSKRALPFLPVSKTNQQKNKKKNNKAKHTHTHTQKHTMRVRGHLPKRTEGALASLFCRRWGGGTPRHLPAHTAWVTTEGEGKFSLKGRREI